jgi:hypothetical protein
MRRSDRWYVADIDGDNGDDLCNALDWSPEYLGTFRSTGGDLIGSRQDDWIGSWNLGRGDDLYVLDFNGGKGWQDLVQSNDNWLRLLRSHAGSSTLSSIYPNWIPNHNYHSAGWW